MYLVFTRTSDLAGIGDTGGMRPDLRHDGAWYNDGEGCGVERQDGRDVQYVALLKIVFIWFFGVYYPSARKRRRVFTPGIPANARGSMSGKQPGWPGTQRHSHFSQSERRRELENSRRATDRAGSKRNRLETERKQKIPPCSQHAGT